MTLESIFMIILVVLIVLWLVSPNVAPRINVDNSSLRTIILIIVIAILAYWLFRSGTFGHHIFNDRI